MTLEQILDQLRRDPEFQDRIQHWETIPACEAVFSDMPAMLSPALQEALHKHGIQRLYSHQSQAIEKNLNGHNTVIVTPTASGKTLCYNIPVLNAVLSDPNSRALYLFPTKALSQDQVHELYQLIHHIEPSIDFDIKSYTFDGDTPAAARKSIRTSGHIVVTNPDMLHTGILPHHTIWVKLFENLRYVVIDEIHQYRGVLGSHVANVIRRLKRICEFYNSKPQFICCSATIANPDELAYRLTGEPAELIDQNGAPQGEKHLLLYNPPVVNRELGIRQSYVQSARKVAERFLGHNIQTIVFARSRLRVELLVTYLKEALARRKKPKNLIRGYRGGYLPLQRRAIERGLRDGSILGVVSTNALELGIDIGRLQVCVMAGYPGTISSTWQQAGRAGRKNEVAIAVLVASSAPLDQYIVEHPDYLLGRSPESGIIDPENLAILLSHIKCAAFELPFTETERFGQSYDKEGGVEETQDILEYLGEHRILHQSSGSWHWMAETYPAEAVSLRSAAEENIVIIDRSNQDEQVIGEVDLFSAPLMVHDDAIYIHESQQYHVDQLDWDRRKAYVHRVQVDYFTDAQLKTHLKILEIAEHQEQEYGSKGYGEIVVNNLATMYKKLKLNTHENIGWGKISLPELEMHTTSFWYSFHEEVHDQLGISKQAFGDGLKAISHVLAQVAPLFVMADPRDLVAQPVMRAPMLNLPTLFIWERYPGGVGFSRKLYHMPGEIARAALERVRECGCSKGCPSCVGPVLEVGDDGKSAAIVLLEKMTSM